MKFSYSLQILIGVIFISISGYSQSNQSNAAAVKKFEKELKVIKIALTGKKTHGPDISFMEEVTGIDSEAPGGYLGKLWATETDYKKWTAWFKVHKEELRLDEETGKIYVIKEAVNSQQCDPDKIVAGLSNDSLKFRAAMVLVPFKLRNGGNIQMHIILPDILSMDIGKIKRECDKNLLIKKLIPALSDTTKDFYSNLLLYELTEFQYAELVNIDKRQHWVQLYKSKDVRKWKKYLKKLN